MRLDMCDVVRGALSPWVSKLMGILSTCGVHGCEVQAGGRSGSRYRWAKL